MLLRLGIVNAIKIGATPSIIGLICIGKVFVCYPKSFKKIILL